MRQPDLPSVAIRLQLLEQRFAALKQEHEKQHRTILRLRRQVRGFQTEIDQVRQLADQAHKMTAQLLRRVSK